MEQFHNSRASKLDQKEKVKSERRWRRLKLAHPGRGLASNERALPDGTQRGSQSWRCRWAPLWPRGHLRRWALGSGGFGPSSAGGGAGLPPRSLPGCGSLPFQGGRPSSCLLQQASPLPLRAVPQPSWRCTCNVREASWPPQLFGEGRGGSVSAESLAQGCLLGERPSPGPERLAFAAPPCPPPRARFPPGGFGNRKCFLRRPSPACSFPRCPSVRPPPLCPRSCSGRAGTGSELLGGSGRSPSAARPKPSLARPPALRRREPSSGTEPGQMGSFGFLCLATLALREDPRRGIPSADGPFVSAKVTLPRSLCRRTGAVAATEWGLPRKAFSHKGLVELSGAEFRIAQTERGFLFVWLAFLLLKLDSFNVGKELPGLWCFNFPYALFCLSEGYSRA